MCSNPSKQIKAIQSWNKTPACSKAAVYRFFNDIFGQNVYFRKHQIVYHPAGAFFNLKSALT
jgi:hypothetical protein